MDFFRKSLLLMFVLLGCLNTMYAQYDDDVLFVKDIHDFTLTASDCYDNLSKLCSKAPGRLAGSKNYDTAVDLMLEILKSYDFDTLYTQDCEVNVWERGNLETFAITKGSEKITLEALTLGNSLGTNGTEISGEIVEVKSLDEVRRLGFSVKDKIVFYNRPMNPTYLNTFYAYSSAVDQRVYGASVAAEYGAKGVIVRSMTLSQDEFPHTGTLVYDEMQPKIPAMSISTNDAKMISELLDEQSITGHINNNPYFNGTKTVKNIITEIKGSTKQNEIILVGGHLDSWDVGEGAHDDGSGCVHAIQVLQTLKNLNYKPKRTIRCVLFANEENGLSGATTYAAKSNEAKEYHLAALESDSGGFSPQSFSFDADTSVLKTYFKNVNDWLHIFEPYHIDFKIAGSGADVGPLKSQKGLLIGLRPDSQKYFDYHHTPNDTFKAINKRELELGAAAMTSLIYLIDTYGL